MHKVTLLQKNKKTKELYIYGDKSLLSELEDENIIITHNCRQGHCGCCILRLIKGDVMHNTSLVPLSDDEILACQCKTVSDICIAFR